jgi:hypothetical protein
VRLVFFVFGGVVVGGVWVKHLTLYAELLEKSKLF